MSFNAKYVKAVALIALATFVTFVTFAQTHAAPADRKAGPTVRTGEKPTEAQLLTVLASGTKPEKAIACKQLAIWGTKDAAPALAPLLLDPELASWARIALEALPGPLADDVLRDALGKLQGRQLAGVINSIAVRRDAKAVDALIAKLKDADANVVSCTGAALGRIGGDAAAAALEQALTGATPALRAAGAEGCISCAESCLTANNRPRAIALYDAVRKADVNKQRVVEATRGAILARQAEGVPMLAELLKSADKPMYAIALRVARELPGKEVYEMLVAELPKATPDRQALLIVVLADRGDAGSLPIVLQAAKEGPKNVRLVAMTALENIGNATCVQVLLDVTADPDADLSLAAKTTLARLNGKDVEAELLARLQKATGKALQAIIELSAQRKIDGSFPVIMKSIDDADAGVRAAAVDAVGAVGEDKQTADLVGLIVKNKFPAEREAVAKALLTLTARCGATCVPMLAPLVKSDDVALRKISLGALSVAGGPMALGAVQNLMVDKDESVCDEAMRTLSTWPNRWSEDASVTGPLMEIAKAPKKPLYKVLALRGYLGYLQGTKQLNAKEKLEKIKEVLPLLVRPEEKRLAISVLGEMNGGAAMEMLTTFTADKDVVEEACVAILHSKQLAKLPKPQAKKALQAVAEKSTNDATKRRAQEALKSL